MQVLLDGFKKILDNGVLSNNRTGVKTLSIFGADTKFDLTQTFPAVTTKPAYMKGAATEVAWMLKGLTTTEYLHEHGVKFWDQWAIKGPTKTLRELKDLRMECFMRNIDVNAMEHLYKQEKFEEIEQVLELPCYHEVDDRYTDRPLNLEDIVNHVVENNLGCKDKTKARLDLIKEAVEELRLDHYPNEYEVIEYNRRRFALPGTITDKTCEVGDLGPVYGHVLRYFPNSDGTTTDQLVDLIERLKTNPTSRRHIVSLWYPELLPDEALSPQQNVALGKQALAPCHWAWAFKTQPLSDEYVLENYQDLIYRNTELANAIVDSETKCCGGVISQEERNKLILQYAPRYKLNLQLIMRSNDEAAGKPVNIMGYALIAHLVAQTVNMEVGELWYTATDAHIYENQLDGIEEQLTRTPLPAPKLLLNKEATVFNFEPNMVSLTGYESHPAIKFAVAV